MLKTKKTGKYILWFEEIAGNDVGLVGGKNASLGEMYVQLSKKGINVPAGFALTVNAYWRYFKANKIDEKLEELFRKFDPKNLDNLIKTGGKARAMILAAKFPDDLKKEILAAYRELSRRYKEKNTDVAVRSSGVAEDQPTTSFAGQFESFLNIKGEDAILEAIKKCLASTFNNRVISYRQEKGMGQLDFALSVGVQKMVRSDLASSGIIFTLDTETGFKDMVLINSIWGIGEMIVKGKVTPDQFYVFKPTLKQGYNSIIVKNLGRKTKKYVYGKNGGLKELSVPGEKQLKFSIGEKDVLILARWACAIEDYYSKQNKKWMPQDIEWAKDGKTGQLFIVQSRPETVHSLREGHSLTEYNIKTKQKPILTGIAIGGKIGAGKARIISDISKINQFKKGEVLITRMTDPDWVSVFPLASAIITNEGGKTCHAAIVARELGIPAIVGAKNASNLLKSGQIITVDCSRGLRGKIYQGRMPFKIKKYNLKKIPKLKVKIMVNVGAPEIAFKTSFLPNDGVGLAREEFIIAEKIKAHPLALYYFNKIQDKKLKKRIEGITIEYKNKKEYFVKKLAEGIGQIAAAFWPKEVIVRFSDFKTNEYASLVGGKAFEPKESNPMLGWRGASRYYDGMFERAFEMECMAVKRVKEIFGLNNISVMVPFCRTVEEGKKVINLLKKFGLRSASKQNANDLKVYVMCEIPSNVILAEDFLKIFDGMSIGSNDLTQLVLGLDRDNAKIAYIGDERNKAIKKMISETIKICRRKKKYCGICGQAPSDFPEFADFLIKEGIESISLNPDTVIKTILSLSKKKKK